MTRELLQRLLVQLHPETYDWQEASKLRAAIESELEKPSPEPVAWAFESGEGLLLDIITPEEHDSHEGMYKVPLYRRPPAQPAPADVGELEYQGNSVAFIHQKMKAYRKGIDDAWSALKAAGVQPDGQTSVAQAIAKLAAQPAPGPLTDRSCTCHPDDNPPTPCPKRYALNECRKADRVWSNEVLRLIQRHAPHIPMSEHGDEARAVFLAFARSVAGIAASPEVPARTWICPRCKVDRFKEDCPNRIGCPMVAVAQEKP